MSRHLVALFDMSTKKHVVVRHNQRENMARARAGQLRARGNIAFTLQQPGILPHFAGVDECSRCNRAVQEAYEAA